jgi:uncharacterized protein (TIGR02687 family)
MSSNLPSHFVALERLFQDGALLVFWNDPEGEYSAQLDALELPGVKVARRDVTPALQIKIWLERESDTPWLVYSPTEEPESENDWLLDARLRAKQFRADIASMQLNELGLATLALRDHLKLRAKFLKARERFDRLKRWTEPTDTADDIDRKMIAALARAETSEPAAIFLKLFGAAAFEGDLGAQPKPMQEIVANKLSDAFWQMAEREFDYKDDSSDGPSLRGLLYAILTTDFCNAIGSTPSPLAHFVIANRPRASQASVFASRWRTDMANYASYDSLSSQVADELRISDLLGPMTAEQLAEAMTFEAVEKRVIADIKARVLVGRGANMDSARQLIARRRDGHWANPLLASASDAMRALSGSYDAIEAAASFFELQAKHGQGFSFANASTGIDAYRSELHQFDHLYRKFMKASEYVDTMGWALLHELRSAIEDAYSGWFMGQLSSSWGSVMEGPSGLLSTWKVDGLVNQQDFYARHVAPAFEGGAKRVFVVISDAFRFEAAAELAAELNFKSRVKAKLDAMLGVLPSYTALGMASLLPHERLAYKTNASLDVSVDGQAANTLEQRSAILSAHGGIAIGKDALMEKGKEKGRELVKPHKLIYVYHDLIDMVGDKRGSETQTFDATARAIKELSELVSFIINNLNTSTVLVTADHGFLYQESAMEEADRSVLPEDPPGVIKSKKRYVLGRGMGTTSKAWCGSTEVTAGTDAGEGSVDFWVPKGAARFHFVGGARFVHGSAMLQEVVVPVITVKDSDSDKAKTKVVEVSLLGSTNKIVTNKQRYEFIQNEAVSERVLPAKLLFSIRDGDKPVSDEQALTFDSSSPMIEERKRSVMLTIEAGSYDRAKDYYLVGRDAKTRAEALRVPLRIDLSFNNDF